MARSLSTQETNARATGHFSTHVRAVVNDGLTDRELNDLEDRDWIRSLRYRHADDSQMATAALVCSLREGEYNLAPLDGGSPLNSSPHQVLLAIGNTIKIYTATMPASTSPVSADWNLVFAGYIEETEVGTNETISIRCVGKENDLLVAYVEEVTTYPKYLGSGSNFEDVISDILTDWGGGVTLNILDDTGGSTAPVADVKEYDQRREPVWQACKAIADQVGWDLKYKWDGTDSFDLYLWEPDRDRSTPDWTLSENEWTSIVVRTGRADVRNVIRIGYYDASVGDERQHYEASDAASISKYGRRWMEIAEEKGSQIDTATEAQTLAELIRDDLKEPTAYIAVNIPYHFGIELKDLVRLTADNIHFNSNQDLAVISYNHEIPQGGRGSTSLQLAGLPSAGRKHWEELQARHSQKRLASRNFGYTVGQRSNVAPNPFFDESDS